jgi:chromosome segregation ATPase
MKRALSVTAVTALSLLVFLFVGYGQEEGAQAVSELLEQELSAMEAVFGGLQALTGELISEIKGNMADIDELDARIEDYKDIVTALSVELKEAEGKIVGLRRDVDALTRTQQELMVRVVALEAGLSELSAFVDELKALLDLNIADLAALRDEFDVLAEAFAAHVVEFEAFKVAVYGDIDALRDGVTADISLLQGQVGDLGARVQALEDEDVGTFKKKVIELERSMAALAIRIDNNRAKLEGFDHAIAGLSEQINVELQDWSANQALEMDSLEQRVAALEDNSDIQAQIDTLFFISIVALLAGVGALIWGFLGNS